MGPFDDPAYVAAEAWYLTPPEWPEEDEERFWDDEEAA